MEGWGKRRAAGEEDRPGSGDRSGFGGSLRPPHHRLAVWGTGLPVGRRGRLAVLEGLGPTKRGPRS